MNSALVIARRAQGSLTSKWYYAPRVEDGQDIRGPYPGEDTQFYGVYERIPSDDPRDEGHLLYEWRADFYNEEDAKTFVSMKLGEMETPAVVVNISGGLCQGVSATVPVRVFTLDEDIEGSSD